MSNLTRRRASARSSLTPGAETNSIRIVEMPDLGAVSDSSSFVGERAGSGRFMATALRDYVSQATLNNVGRNAIQNGLFNVAQRGSGPINATGAQAVYAADRWQVQSGVAGDTMGMTLNPHTDASRAQIGDEAAKTMASLTFIGSGAAKSMCRIVHKIENVHRLSGKTVTVSFYAIGSVANKLGVSIDQYFGAGVSPSVSGVGQAVTVSNAIWTRHSVTLVVPSIGGKTLGYAGDCTILNIWGSAGSTFNGLSGGVGNQTWFANIWGVQLEISAVATPIEKPSSAQTELADCQRYYQRGTVGMAGYNAAGNAIQHTTQLPVTMRTIPTVTPSGITQVNCTGVLATPFGGPGTITVQATVTATGHASFFLDYAASADL